ncbi:MAG: ribosomal subunit interface protein [Kordiimonas sp.]|nr:ribosomal subunit interface protein [Kordiimonas sp.]|tara:strand:- start:1092 stop:1664 length:573 start_codon:yes stop_codon:yes gene_type:complete
MSIVVTGKQMDVGDALRTYVEDSLTDIVSKYFNQAFEGVVTFHKDRHLFQAECHIQLGHGVLLQSHGEADEVYVSFDDACAKIEKRLRRYKRRLTNHHRSKENGYDLLAAQSYVLAAEEENADEPAEDSNPIIVAEMETSIPEVTVSEAVMRMDLADTSTLMFRNSAHGRLNVIYRRPDGNIGWIDPKVE